MQTEVREIYIYTDMSLYVCFYKCKYLFLDLCTHTCMCVSRPIYTSVYVSEQYSLSMK